MSGFLKEKNVKLSKKKIQNLVYAITTIYLKSTVTSLAHSKIRHLNRHLCVITRRITFRLRSSNNFQPQIGMCEASAFLTTKSK